MGVPYQNVDMTSHFQYVTVRNERGQELLDSIRSRLEVTPTTSTGSRASIVMQVCVASHKIKLFCLLIVFGEVHLALDLLQNISLRL